MGRVSSASLLLKVRIVVAVALGAEIRRVIFEALKFNASLYLSGRPLHCHQQPMQQELIARRDNKGVVAQAEAKAAEAAQRCKEVEAMLKKELGASPCGSKQVSVVVVWGFF
jgi:hypothetical protein